MESDMSRLPGRIAFGGTRVTELYTPDFETAWAAYPKRGGGNSKRDAWKAWSARRKAGEDVGAIYAGIVRYAAYCAATGAIGTVYVMQAARFFGPSHTYEETWDAPAERGTRELPPPDLDQHGYVTPAYQDVLLAYLKA